MRLKEIHYLNTEDIDTEERDFRAGQLHITYEMPHDQDRRVPRKRTRRCLQNRAVPGRCILSVQRHQSRPEGPPRAPRAGDGDRPRRYRQERHARRPATRAQSYVPPNPAGYMCQSRVPTDYERRTQAAGGGGFPGGKGLPPVEMLINTSENHRAIAEAIQQTWRKELGIDARVRNEEWKVYLASQHALNYTTSRSGWIGDYLDPFTFLSLFVTGNGNNDTGYSNPEYDRLIAAAHNAPTDAERLAVFQQAETVLLDDAPRRADLFLHPRVPAPAQREGLVQQHPGSPHAEVYLS